jgi:hypothetical protein
MDSFKIPDCFDERVRALWAGPTLVEKEDGHLYYNDVKYAVKICTGISDREFPLYITDKDTAAHQIQYIKVFGERARHWIKVYYMSSGTILYRTLDDNKLEQQMLDDNKLEPQMV